MRLFRERNPPLRARVAQLAVLTSVEQKRLALGQLLRFDHLADEDRVVAAMVLGDRTAIEVGERAVNNGRAGGGEGVRKLVQAVGAIELLLREAVRDCGLVFVEDVDGKDPRLREDVVRVRRFVHADEHERWVEREGCYRVCGHAMQIFTQARRDNGDACGEAAHGSTELFLRGHQVGPFSPFCNRPDHKLQRCLRRAALVGGAVFAPLKPFAGYPVFVRDGDVREAQGLRLGSPAGSGDAGDGKADVRSRPGADALGHLSGSLFAYRAVLVERLAGNADPLHQAVVIGNDAAEKNPRGTRSLSEDVTDESSGQRFSDCQLQSFGLQASERLPGKRDEIVRLHARSFYLLFFDLLPNQNVASTHAVTVTTKIKARNAMPWTRILVVAATTIM